MTTYTYRTTITVKVSMADEGEDFEGEPVHWGSLGEQEKQAREYAESLMPILDDMEEDFISIDAPQLTLVSE